MRKLILAMFIVLALTLVIASPALALKGKPDFSPHLFGDGEMWGTKATAIVKGPNGNNDQSFNKLFIITYEGGLAQLPLADAAPGNPDYTPRWWTHTVEWVVAPHALLTFNEEKDVYHPVDDWNNLAFHVSLGHLVITEGSFAGGPPDYFVCPLLPVKD
jgi:hypothetical protein